MRNSILILLAILLFSSACNENGTKSSSNGKSKDRNNNSNKSNDKEEHTDFSISVPEGWEKTTETKMGHSFTLLRSPREDMDDPFMENVNVVYEKTGSASLQEYIKGSLRQLNTLESFVNKDISYRAINGMEFGVVDYSHQYGGIDIDVRTYITVKDGTGYVITCSAEGEKFSKWESTFEETIRSFELQ